MLSRIEATYYGWSCVPRTSYTESISQTVSSTGSNIGIIRSSGPQLRIGYDERLEKKYIISSKKLDCTFVNELKKVVSFLVIA